MNIIFLTLADFNSLSDSNIYTDLLREFVKSGHSVYAISPVERRKRESTHFVREKNATILKLKIGNVQKTNVIEKGISTIRIEPQFIRAIKQYFNDIKFDLVLYSTPPITFYNAVKFIKKRDSAQSYLLLKDIFPQNAVDLEMMSKTGPKGIIYRYFRNKEKKLYAISDWIGCMSQANVDYVRKHNLDVNPEKVEVCPNSIEIIDKSIDDNTRIKIRKKYGIPMDKTVFIYGGNLGRPQGIPFLIECMKSIKDVEDAFFIIVGSGTEYDLLDKYVKTFHQENLRLMSRLPKVDYDNIVSACDVGMIFLDNRFTVPNFPSRLLSYMQAKVPVFAITDSSTDIGEIITKGEFGWWCESNNSSHFKEIVGLIIRNDNHLLKENSFNYLKNNYDVKKYAAQIIAKI